MTSCNSLRLVGSLIAIAVFTASCSSSSSSTPPPAGVDGGDGATPGPPSNAWALGTCGACVTSGCAPQRQVCDAEPSCASHAACVDKCPSDASGSIDAACVAACPRGDNTVASRVRAGYDSCITGSGPKACVASACPKPAGEPPPLNEVLDQQCSGSTETNACFKCEDLSCCKTFDACVAEPECKQGIQPCITACKADNTCKAGCYAAHPKGVATWARRQACMTARCVTECGGTTDACYDCGVRTSCRETNARCAADEGCFLLKACLDRDCTSLTDSCVATCKSKVPASAGPLFDAWYACIAVSCTNVCS